MTSVQNNRVHVQIMENIHTKYELDRVRHGRLIVFTSKITWLSNLDPVSHKYSNVDFGFDDPYNLQMTFKMFTTKQLRHVTSFMLIQHV